MLRPKRLAFIFMESLTLVVPETNVPPVTPIIIVVNRDFAPDQVARLLIQLTALCNAPTNSKNVRMIGPNVDITLVPNTNVVIWIMTFLNARKAIHVSVKITKDLVVNV